MWDKFLFFVVMDDWNWLENISSKFSQSAIIIYSNCQLILNIVDNLISQAAIIIYLNSSTHFERLWKPDFPCSHNNLFKLNLMLTHFERRRQPDFPCSHNNLLNSTWCQLTLIFHAAIMIYLNLSTQLEHHRQPDFPYSHNNLFKLNLMLTHCERRRQPDFPCSHNNLFKLNLMLTHFERRWQPDFPCSRNNLFKLVNSFWTSSTTWFPMQP